MTGSTKILTVSYGTFSCTLEGFDDPFGTMRGIAEYFRDLAADDRYFGAEPPTPDVEMLQRIAEKEVQRRVEARLGDRGVALTQVTDDTSVRAKPAAQMSDAEEDEVVARVTRAVSQPSPAAKPEAAEFDRGPLAPDEDYLLSDEPEDVLAVDPDARPPAEGPAETVAEKLRRIRAVVSRNIEQRTAEEDRSFREAQARDAAASDAAPKRSRALTETIRQISDDLSDDEEAFASDYDLSEEFEGDPETATNAFATGNDQDDDDSSVEAIGASGESDLDEGTMEIASPVEDDGWSIADDADEADADPEVASSESTASEHTAGSSPDADDDFSDADTISQVMSKSRASDVDAEDDEATDVLHLGAQDAIEPQEPAPSTSRRVSRPLTSITESENDVGRILAETDNKMNEGEGIRRRRVISQMRAAVAATKADRLVSRRVMTPEDEAAAEQEPYRDALSEVVGKVSRSPVKDGSARKGSVAPLVLVSSQRVDDVRATPKPASVLPRLYEDGEGFAGFVKAMGAKELSELLEAAAAYTAFVEGQPSFSRPEIMKRVARVDPALKLTREDGLRSFGQLLRQGKFQKLERGQFTVAKNTRFNPHLRVAGE